MKTAYVAGSSGFIGGHLVRQLKQQGYFVIGADVVKPVYEKPNLFFNYDLTDQLLAKSVFAESYALHKHKIDRVYILACLMGGMGFIGDVKQSYAIMAGSTKILVNTLDACIEYEVGKVFYSSSACVYNETLQMETGNCSLKEEDAYPALPDLVYGWQKLNGEHQLQAAYKTYGLNIRIARFHNIFGIEGIWDGGKEKYPAAICRKVAQAKDGDTITVWGDGKATRSFLYIDECLEGVERLMNSDNIEPINIGSDELISVEDLAQMVIDISGKDLKIEHDMTKPQGVRGRNSDNQFIEKTLGWKPTAPLKEGITKLYHWINEKVCQ